MKFVLATGLTHPTAMSLGTRLRLAVVLAERRAERACRIVSWRGCAAASSGFAAGGDDVRDGHDHPLALAVDPSGGLLVADWGRGVIYEIVRV